MPSWYQLVEIVLLENFLDFEIFEDSGWRTGIFEDSGWRPGIFEDSGRAPEHFEEFHHPISISSKEDLRLRLNFLQNLNLNILFDCTLAIFSSKFHFP